MSLTWLTFTNRAKYPPHLEGGCLEVDVGDEELVGVFQRGRGDVEDVSASSNGVGIGAHGGFEMRKI